MSGEWEPAPFLALVGHAQVDDRAQVERPDGGQVVAFEMAEAVGTKQRAPARLTPVGCFVAAEVAEVVDVVERNETIESSLMHWLDPTGERVAAG